MKPLALLLVLFAAAASAQEPECLERARAEYRLRVQIKADYVVQINRHWSELTDEDKDRSNFTLAELSDLVERAQLAVAELQEAIERERRGELQDVTAGRVR